MSTKAHFIYENGIEGYEETSEPQSIFGKFTGYNVYFFISNVILEAFEVKDDYLYIKTNSPFIPEKIKIWGDAIISANWDINDGLLLIFKGGHHITKQIISLTFVRV